MQINYIHIFMPMTNKKHLVISRIFNGAVGFFKSDMIFFITHLTNTKLVMFQSFNEQHIFENGRRSFTDTTFTDDLSLTIVSEGYVTSFFGFKG